MNWANTPETSINYHQAGPNIEPTMKKKKRTCKKYVETGSPDTHTTRTGFNWGELKKAQDRRLWKTVVNGLWVKEGEEEDKIMTFIYVVIGRK